MQRALFAALTALGCVVGCSSNDSGDPDEATESEARKRHWGASSTAAGSDAGVDAAASKDATAPLGDASGNAPSQEGPATWGNNGGVVTALSASYVDVKAAIAAASAGDIVQIPSGTATWGATLTVNKPLTLRGTGTTAPNLTKIINGGAKPLVNIALTVNAPVRISGIYFDNVTSASNSDKTLVRISGRDWNGSGQELTQVRIDHNTFNQGARQILVFGWAYGVIDHNYFLNPDIAIGFQGDDTRAWSRPIAPATADAMFVEDNRFVVNDDCDTSSFDEVLYHQEGARSTTRYNVFDLSAYTKQDNVLFDTHGNGNRFTGNTNSDFRGQPMIEVYRNQIHLHHTYQVMGLRGGSQLIFDNTMVVDHSAPSMIKLTEEDGWQTAFFNPLDTAWPAEDQINNSFFWNNSLNGSPVTGVYLPYAADRTFLQEGRDYFLHAPSATGGRTSYTSRPGGDETFNPAVANAYYPYAPFTYPHPLAK